MTPHQIENRRRAGYLAAAKNKERGTAFFDPQVRQKAVDAEGHKTTNKQRWLSLASGMISTSGAIGSHHRKNGFAKEDRVQLTNAEYSTLIGMDKPDRLMALRGRTEVHKTQSHT